VERRPLGQLIYRKTARNFNPMMATAADYVIAEVEELVNSASSTPITFIRPAFSSTPFSRAEYEKRIERRTVRKA